MPQRRRAENGQGQPSKALIGPCPHHECARVRSSKRCSHTIGIRRGVKLPETSAGPLHSRCPLSATHACPSAKPPHVRLGGMTSGPFLCLPIVDSKLSRRGDQEKRTGL